MNLLDVAFIVVLVGFAFYGALKGLVRLALGWTAVMIGIFLGCWYNEPAAGMLEGVISNEAARRLAALAAIFFVTVASALVVIWLLTKSLDAVRLRWVDRLSGAALGTAIAAILLAAAMIPLAAFAPSGNALLRESTLAPHVQIASGLLKSLVPDDLKRRYEGARRRMRESGKGILPGERDLPAPPGLPDVVEGIEKIGEARAAAERADSGQSEPERAQR